METTDSPEQVETADTTEHVETEDSAPHVETGSVVKGKLVTRSFELKNTRDHEDSNAKFVENRQQV